MNTPVRHILGLEHVDASLHGCVLTIGNFDGVHQGHRRIVATARALADAANVPVVAMTFDPPPVRLLRPKQAPLMISPHDYNVNLLSQAGCDVVVTIQTTPAFLERTADDFLQEIIHTRFRPRHIVEGSNFFFGHQRAGTVETLRAAADRLDFTVHVVDAVLVDLDGQATTVSSSRIRTLIADGRLEDARRLLARPFALQGPIVPGDQIGQAVLKYPTANLDPGLQICPGDGVYAGVGIVDGQRWPAAISIGRKPTFGPDRNRVIEAHLLGAAGDLYGRSMELVFLKKLRDQILYDSLEALRDQISRDVRDTQEIAREFI